jgi:excisionase family DNA binding protein
MTGRLLLTLTEVADELRVSRPTVERWVGRGEIPSVKLGTCRRVRSEDLAQWVAAKVEAGLR